MTQPKRIGVLTSGGDCPGLNAVIRSVVKCASRKGWEVYGIPYGTDGFLAVQDGTCTVEELRLKEHGYDIPGVLHGLDVLQFLSGSILGSISKGDPRKPGIKEQILAGYSKLGLDALVVIGGDGSLDIIYSLAEAGNWNLIAVPKTIDNDVPFTERAVGFSTAVDTVTNALYNLTFTAASHDRVMVVQVMGRDAGHLALHSGIAAGADVILIPELVRQLDGDVMKALCVRLADIRQDGRKFALVVVAEGVRGADGKSDKYIGDRLAELIKQRSQELCDSGEQQFCPLKHVDTRSTNLGHIQRAGTPSSFDRLLGISFGKKAIDLIEAEDYNQLVVWKSGGVETRPLSEVIPILRRCHTDGCCPGPVAPDDYLVQVARSLGIYVGNGDG